jgi:hypothetical protein
MGSDRSRRLTLNADGSLTVEHSCYSYPTGDHCGPEYYYERTDKGTYVREGDAAIVFTIASSECSADLIEAEVDRAKELVGKTVRCAIVSGKVMGYPSPGFASESDCPMSV